MGVFQRSARLLGVRHARHVHHLPLGLDEQHQSVTCVRPHVACLEMQTERKTPQSGGILL